ncbi:MAG: uroporphyrinogen decarboxylase family protein [Bacteroidota bacterium]
MPELTAIPISHPHPDAKESIAILAGKSSSRRVPLVEYIVDDHVMRPIVEDVLGRKWVPFGCDRESQKAYLDNFIQFWLRMGYDFVRFEQSLPFPEKKLVTADAAPGSTAKREWADEHHGAIESWEDFYRYTWPQVEEFDFFALEYLSRNLPDGMGLITSHGGGVFEHLSWIMSMEGLAVALHEEPGLVRATADRLGELMMSYYLHLLDLDNVVAIFPGDDMGYRSATLISPNELRTYVLPWHKRFASLAHARGLPYFLHSCGNIAAIMEDLLTDVGIDGKHSYEDAILPVQEFQSRYAGRLAVLGGLDINILSGASPEGVRKHTTFLMRTCGPRGRYAVGSGNSVPSYVPVENYLAMVDQVHRTNARDRG